LRRPPLVFSCCCFLFLHLFLLVFRRHPRSTFFPYTTLFRSGGRGAVLSREFVDDPYQECGTDRRRTPRGRLRCSARREGAPCQETPRVGRRIGRASRRAQRRAAPFPRSGTPAVDIGGAGAVAPASRASLCPAARARPTQRHRRAGSTHAAAPPRAPPGQRCGPPSRGVTQNAARAVAPGAGAGLSWTHRRPPVVALDLEGDRRSPPGT